MKNPRYRVFFSITSTIVLFTLLYNTPFTKTWGNKQKVKIFTVKNVIKLRELKICEEFHDHKGYKTSCEFLKANPECNNSSGFFNYIKFFYCDLENYRAISYFLLSIWLAILFYLLGNTAADYFCCSLENLSSLLRMSPTIAGVTLLPLGNGASDVFASIAAFMGTGSGAVGLNGVLGGAVFITCVVVGVVALSVAGKMVQIDKKCFVRDLSFLLFSVVCLGLVIVVGEVTVLGAVLFLSIYFVYIGYVVVSEVVRKKGGGLKEGVSVFTPLLPVVGEVVLASPGSGSNPVDVSSKDGHWIWSLNFAMYSDYVKVRSGDDTVDTPRDVWGWASNEEGESMVTFSRLCSLLEMPLNFPRRLTVPIIEEDRWSKMYAIASAFLAPVLLAFLWNTQENISPLSGKIAYFIGFGIGFVLSVLASLYTVTDHPPRRCLFPWIFGGFFMSIVWFYIVASELVSLLVSLGTILGINPSMLALTVLAWGNSMNDLMSNTAFAMNERNGVQIAMSGCYAGPMFNTLVGLGLSLVLGAWSSGSDPYVIPRDAGLFVTMAFLTGGVVWSLVVLPLNDMRPNKVLGIGLIVIYVLFLSIRICMAIGIGTLNS